LEYIVAREFRDEHGRLLTIGEPVAAEHWRNRDTLIRSRYLRAVGEAVGAPARFAVVTREFSHNGGLLRPGTVVDLTGWRNVDTLIAARYLRVANDADLGQAPTPPLVLPPEQPHAPLEVAGASGPTERKGKGRHAQPHR